jgi:site-specific DNA-adenine methylase
MAKPGPGEVGGGVSLATYERHLRLASEIMMRTHPRITWLDYHEVLKGCDSGDVVYLDPPKARSLVLLLRT